MDWIKTARTDGFTERDLGAEVLVGALDEASLTVVAVKQVVLGANTTKPAGITMVDVGSGPDHTSSAVTFRESFGAESSTEHTVSVDTVLRRSLVSITSRTSYRGNPWRFHLTASVLMTSVTRIKDTTALEEELRTILVVVRAALVSIVNRRFDRSFRSTGTTE